MNFSRRDERQIDDWRLEIVHRFQNAAAQWGKESAVVADGLSITYSELDRRSDQLCQFLRNLGLGPGAVVATLIGRTVHIGIAYLASLKAGIAFVPLDPQSPSNVNMMILEECGASLVLSTSAVLAELNHELPIIAINIEQLNARSIVVVPGRAPAGTAYIIYTSGSTGRSKGAANTHEGLLRLVDGLSEVIPGSVGGRRQRVALVAPFVFDPSIQQIFYSLLNGHALHIASNEQRRDGSLLLSFLNDRKIDVSDGTPMHLRLLSHADAALGDALFPTTMLIGGEQLTPQTISEFVHRFERGEVVGVINLYGVAECAVDSTYYHVDKAEVASLGYVPIGTPLRGTQVWLVDESDREVPQGVVGEVVIGGAGVGLGYIQDEMSIEPRFLKLATGEIAYKTGDLASMGENGFLRYVGRKDRQLKLNGIRIEPGHIEAAIREFRSLNAANRRSHARCERCLLTDHHPGVVIENGICSVCAQFDQYRQKAECYFQTVPDFQQLMQDLRTSSSSHFDCMLLYSGGKDSTYVLLKLIELGYNVKTFTFDNGYISSTAFKNIELITSKYGVAHTTLNLRNMNDVFRESLRQDSTVCSGCFNALSKLSTKLARDLGINVIISGLSRGQIFDTKLRRLFESHVFDRDEIDRRLREHRRFYDLRTDPVSRAVGINVSTDDSAEISYIDFFRYDGSTSEGVRRYLSDREEAWQSPQDTGFCSTNCKVNEVGIHVHSVEKGYHNYAAPLSWDIRLGIVSKADAAKELAAPNQGDGVNEMLSAIGFTPRTGSPIKDVAVTIIKSPAGRPAIVAYYTSLRDFSIEDLKGYLRSRLPDFMVPVYFFELEKLPMTSNGKLDLSALPVPEIASSNGQILSQSHEKVHRIWREVLGLNSIGIDDNFFDVGGDSLLATIIASRLSSDFKKKLRIADAFRYGTIREMAHWLDGSP